MSKVIILAVKVLLESAKFMFGMTSISQQKRAHVEKSLCVDLAMF